MIEYNHADNRHSVEGAIVALREIFPTEFPRSILDVGCGTGTWLKAASELGASEVFGVDGIGVEHGKFLGPPNSFSIQDLRTDWSLDRRFDLCLCLEVGEHLPLQESRTLIKCLTRHSDLVLFSAAIPNQAGQHHVNCQWPEFWQKLFNEEGFSCSDDLRWKIWNCADVEPWYRQNLFCARKEPELAGIEPRIKSVVHPDLVEWFLLGAKATERELTERMMEGRYTAAFYSRMLLSALSNKIERLSRRWR